MSLGPIVAVQEPIDEVLFSSIIEACIRIKRLDSLSDFIGRYKVKGLFKSLRCPFSSILFARFVRFRGNSPYSSNLAVGFVFLHCVQEHLCSDLRGHDQSPLARPVTSIRSVNSGRSCGSASDWNGETVWRHVIARQSHNVKPTAITIGCVVEALVINKQGEEAWQLVQDRGSSSSCMQGQTLG